MAGATFLELAERLIVEPSEKRAFLEDREGYLDKRGFGDLSADDVSDAIEHVAQTLPPPVAMHLADAPGLDGLAEADLSALGVDSLEDFGPSELRLVEGEDGYDHHDPRGGDADDRDADDLDADDFDADDFDADLTVTQLGARFDHDPDEIDAAHGAPPVFSAAPTGRSEASEGDRDHRDEAEPDRPAPARHETDADRALDELDPAPHGASDGFDGGFDSGLDFADDGSALPLAEGLDNPDDLDEALPPGDDWEFDELGDYPLPNDPSGDHLQ